MVVQVELRGGERVQLVDVVFQGVLEHHGSHLRVSSLEQHLSSVSVLWLWLAAGTNQCGQEARDAQDTITMHTGRRRCAGGRPRSFNFGANVENTHIRVRVCLCTNVSF